MNEIALQGDGALIMSSGGDLSELIKPLSREIHLFDTYIAGTANTARQLIDRLNSGDMLDLRSETNKFEENAVAVNSEGNKVGYIPEKDVIITSSVSRLKNRLVRSRLMYSTKSSTARVIPPSMR